LHGRRRKRRREHEGGDDALRNHILPPLSLGA
jgi:hypothetical protein